MEQLPELHEVAATFQDYKLKGTKLIGARAGELEQGDIVTDEFGIIGMVKFQSEKYGNLIEFVDGLEVYDKKVKGIKKLSTNNPALFTYNQRYYGFITRLARIMLESLSEKYPHANMFNNGKTLYVRASTLSSITKHFTHQKIGNQHNYISLIFDPFYTCHIEEFVVRPPIRKSRWAYNTLRDLFIDVDLKMQAANRIKFVISEHHDYNDVVWDLIYRHFGKFQLKRARGD